MSARKRRLDLHPDLYDLHSDLCSDLRPDLLRPSVLKELCARAGIRPDRKSGQNFLINRVTLERIVATVDPRLGDTILEVGAGFGVLTLALAERLAALTQQGSSVAGQQRGRIIAIERDRHITPLLRELAMSYGNVEVVEGDIIALFRRGVSIRRSMWSVTPKGSVGAMSNGEIRMTNQCSNDEYPKQFIRISDFIRHSSFGLRHSREDARPAIDRSWKLVANLPYGITSDFLRLLFDAVETGALPPPERVVVLLQREVVDRLVADPRKLSDRRAVGLLTILTQLHCAPRRILRVPPAHFWPVPKVESAVITLEHWRTPEQIETLLIGERPPPHAPPPRRGRKQRDDFLHLVRSCFAGRRRQIGRSLRGVMRDPSAALRMTRIDPTARPETLTLTQWVALARALSHN